jgi:hypothetical protein
MTTAKEQIMADKLLVFHPNEADWKKIKQIANAQKIRAERVEPARYMQTLGTLATGGQFTQGKTFAGRQDSYGKTSVGQQSSQGQVPAESMIVMCGFSEKEMDKLLAALKKAQVPIDYKAILTPTNRRWNVLRLLLELGVEKRTQNSDGKGENK